MNVRHFYQRQYCSNQEEGTQREISIIDLVFEAEEEEAKTKTLNQMSEKPIIYC